MDFGVDFGVDGIPKMALGIPKMDFGVHFGIPKIHFGTPKWTLQNELQNPFWSSFWGWFWEISKIQNEFEAILAAYPRKETSTVQVDLRIA